MLAFGGAELLPELAKRRGEDARHLRLREAELERDPLLAPVTVEAQDDHPSLAAAERSDAGVEEQALLGPLELQARGSIPEGVVEGHDHRPGPHGVGAARTTDGPRPIPHGAPELADDRRDRIRAQVSPSLRGEAV